MLFHLLRNLGVVVRALRRPAVTTVQTETVLPLRVRLADMDYNGHMNNARYLDVLELGRVDALVRSGLAKIAWRRRLMPIVASLQIRYMAELKRRDRFRVCTRVTGWDERWMWIEQDLVRERDTKVCARAVFRAQFRTRQGAYPPATLLHEAGFADVATHVMPPHLAAFGAAEANLHRALAASADEHPHRAHRPRSVA
jgi:YbgC/YbaW family acyl-CoA thioester hydrolase